MQFFFLCGALASCFGFEALFIPGLGVLGVLGSWGLSILYLYILYLYILYLYILYLYLSMFV